MAGLRLPRLKTCCCGCSLETGAKIIAYANIAKVVILGLSVFVVVVQSEMKRFEEHSQQTTQHFEVGALLRDQLWTAQFLMSLLFSTSLLIGVRKRSPTLMWPSQVWQATQIILRTCEIFLFAMARLQGVRRFFVFPLLAATALNSYAFTIVHSLICEIEERSLRIHQESLWSASEYNTPRN